jgi:hypothetical protein
MSRQQAAPSLAVLVLFLQGCASDVTPIATERTDLPSQVPSASATADASAAISAPTPELMRTAINQFTITPGDLYPGQFLVFREPDTAVLDSWNIFVSDISGHRVGSIAKGQITGAIISPNGSLLALSLPSLVHNERTSLEIVNLKSGDVVLTFAPNEALGPEGSWSPDGTMIALSLDYKIAILDLATNTTTIVADCSNFLEGSDCSFPAWSPDGQTIAFVLSFPGAGLPRPQEEGVYLVDVGCMRDNATCRTLTRGPVSPGRFPAWSPGGDAIALIVEHASGSAIRVVDPSTGSYLSSTTVWEASDPSSPGFPEWLSWSPEATLITFVEGCTIQSLSAATGEIKSIVDEGDSCDELYDLSWILVK